MTNISVGSKSYSVVGYDGQNFKQTLEVIAGFVSAKSGNKLIIKSGDGFYRFSVTDNSLVVEKWNAEKNAWENADVNVVLGKLVKDCHTNRTNFKEELEGVIRGKADEVVVETSYSTEENEFNIKVNDKWDAFTAAETEYEKAQGELNGEMSKPSPDSTAIKSKKDALVKAKEALVKAKEALVKAKKALGEDSPLVKEAEEKIKKGDDLVKKAEEQIGAIEKKEKEGKGAKEAGGLYDSLKTGTTPVETTDKDKDKAALEAAKAKLKSSEVVVVVTVGGKRYAMLAERGADNKWHFISDNNKIFYNHAINKGQSAEVRVRIDGDGDTPELYEVKYLGDGSLGRNGFTDVLKGDKKLNGVEVIKKTEGESKESNVGSRIVVENGQTHIVVGNNKIPVTNAYIKAFDADGNGKVDDGEQASAEGHIRAHADRLKISYDDAARMYATSTSFRKVSTRELDNEYTHLTTSFKDVDVNKSYEENQQHFSSLSASAKKAIKTQWDKIKTLGGSSFQEKLAAFLLRYAMASMTGMYEILGFESDDFTGTETYNPKEVKADNLHSWLETGKNEEEEGVGEGGEKKRVAYQTAQIDLANASTDPQKTLGIYKKLPADLKSNKDIVTLVINTLLTGRGYSEAAKILAGLNSGFAEAILFDSRAPIDDEKLMSLAPALKSVGDTGSKKKYYDHFLAKAKEETDPNKKIEYLEVASWFAVKGETGYLDELKKMAVPPSKPKKGGTTDKAKAIDETHAQKASTMIGDNSSFVREKTYFKNIVKEVESKPTVKAPKSKKPPAQTPSLLQDTKKKVDAFISGKTTFKKIDLNNQNLPAAEMPQVTKYLTSLGWTLDKGTNVYNKK